MNTKMTTVLLFTLLNLQGGEAGKTWDRIKRFFRIKSKNNADVYGNPLIGGGAPHVPQETAARYWRILIHELELDNVNENGDIVIVKPRQVISRIKSFMYLNKPKISSLAGVPFNLSNLPVSLREQDDFQTHIADLEQENADLKYKLEQTEYNADKAEIEKLKKVIKKQISERDDKYISKEFCERHYMSKATHNQVKRKKEELENEIISLQNFKTENKDNVDNYDRVAAENKTLTSKLNVVTVRCKQLEGVQAENQKLETDLQQQGQELAQLQKEKASTKNFLIGRTVRFETRGTCTWYTVINAKFHLKKLYKDQPGKDLIWQGRSDKMTWEPIEI